MPYNLRTSIREKTKVPCDFSSVLSLSLSMWFIAGRREREACLTFLRCWKVHADMQEVVFHILKMDASAMQDTPKLTSWVITSSPRKYNVCMYKRVLKLTFLWQTHQAESRKDIRKMFLHYKQKTFEWNNFQNLTLWYIQKSYFCGWAAILLCWTQAEIAFLPEIALLITILF